MCSNYSSFQSKLSKHFHRTYNKTQAHTTKLTGNKSFSIKFQLVSRCNFWENKNNCGEKKNPLFPLQVSRSSGRANNPLDEWSKVSEINLNWAKLGDRIRLAVTAAGWLIEKARKRDGFRERALPFSFVRTLCRLSLVKKCRRLAWWGRLLSKDKWH